LLLVGHWTILAGVGDVPLAEEWDVMMAIGVGSIVREIGKPMRVVEIVTGRPHTRMAGMTQAVCEWPVSGPGPFTQETVDLMDLREEPKE
jgi:hypothetical protein